MPRRDYQGQVIRVESSITKISFDWSQSAIPQGAKLYGLEWTASREMTVPQLEMIGTHGVLLVRDPLGEVFLRVPLATIPLKAGLGDRLSRHTLPTSMAVSFNSTWTAEISFHDRKADPENGIKARQWSTFPGKTWIRVDIIDRSDLPVPLPAGEAPSGELTTEEP